MGRFQSRALRFAILFVSIIIFTANFCFRFSSSAHDFSILDFDSNLVYQDYSPPVPPPSSPPPPSPPPPTPPQFPPSISCESDLEGIGSLDTTCLIVNDLNLTGNLYITGKGNFHVLPRVRFQCPTPGCSITFDMAGNFSLGNSSSIVTGSFYLRAYNATFFAGSVVNTTGFAGNPPPQTSGTPQGVDGAGGGHGGRGACCLADPSKFPEDVWGGDAYSWSSLQKPCSYGSRGGTTSKEVEYGGFGGGRIRIDIRNLLVVNGSFLADGGNGGMKGGGGSGGSVYVKAHKM